MSTHYPYVHILKTLLGIFSFSVLIARKGSINKKKKLISVKHELDNGKILLEGLVNLWTKYAKNVPSIWPLCVSFQPPVCSQFFNTPLVRSFHVAFATIFPEAAQQWTTLFFSLTFRNDSNS